LLGHSLSFIIFRLVIVNHEFLTSNDCRKRNDRITNSNYAPSLSVDRHHSQI